jgi:hypothetical protein
MPDANHATIACTFSSDDVASSAILALSNAGLVDAWRVGAIDKVRAAAIARAVAAAADVDPLDPLRGVVGVASGGDAASGVNLGALIGGAAGAAVGFLGGSTSLGALMPVEPSLRAIAATMLFFALGIAVGGVLGGAFGKRPSTHAGFRLIDAMEAGEIAVIGSVLTERSSEARKMLEDNAAADIIVIAAN